MMKRKMGVLTVVIWIVTVVLLVIIVSKVKGSNGSEVICSIETPITEVPTTEELITEISTEEICKIGSNETSGEIGSDEENGKVNLFNCHTLYNEWDKFSSQKFDIEDNLGNIHSVTRIFGACYGDKLTVTLDKKYSSLEIPTIFLTDKWKDTASNMHLIFYDQNDNIIKVTPNFTSGVKPESCVVNVEGVEDLTIEIDGEMKGYDGIDWDWVEIGIDEAWLY